MGGAAGCAMRFAPARRRAAHLQARILYAYQIEDANQLVNLIQNLDHIRSNQPGADAALRYHLAHAQYRATRGCSRRDRKACKAAALAFGDCVDQLKAILDHDAKSVEGPRRCNPPVTRSSPGIAAWRRCCQVVPRRGAPADRAGARAPRNPRVLYLEAMDGLVRSKRGSPEHKRAFEQLQQSAQLFDQSSGTREDVPGWGHAEAYLALGIQLQARGDVLGARNWLEKSLLAAPRLQGGAEAG